ncbi:heavy metal translocating P-type ATPase [Timonella senegalensis]|uniref:heavy metal translocating P-type ATPase n=1 Tax=Timonella senegalensis TaxID=1465825 RepID=UPI0028B20D02|nr:heavy metal translocating P-type ATPase [Timonella senegalensis]
MTKTFRFLKHYPVLSTTIVVGLVGLLLWALSFPDATRYLFTAYAIIIVVWQAVDMVKEMLAGKFGLDILAVVAIIATLLVGEYVASWIIILMITGGEALEDFAARRAKRDLSALLDNAPTRAHLLVGEDIREIAASEVAIGDVLLVRPSELVPVDGELLSDAGAFDQSSLTGESIPVEKVAGDEVFSGTLNGQRAVKIRATATTATSQYQQIVDLVAGAEEDQAPTVRLADRYAVPFTVLSLTIAGIAWAVSGNPTRFAEVLVLATPCPLLIAAPVAFISGMSRSAKNKVVVKNGAVLENLSRAGSVYFDKTGTLTQGHPQIARIEPAAEAALDETELLQLAASAEQYSSHVLAAALITEAKTRGIELSSSDEAHEEATNGVTARLNGRKVIVGKLAYVKQFAPSANVAHVEPGETAIYVAVDGMFAGALIARDELRVNARATVETLRRSGVERVALVTGDAQETADSIAEQTGIDTVHAQCLPADKVEIVAQANPRPIIMVGDGVNDAPALARADVGIAMGARGATVASQAADAVILTDDISRVAAVVEISKRTMRVALQSIWIGIALSVILMLIAAFGFIPATAGALTQEVVDLVAILAALRALKGTRKEDEALAAVSARVMSASAKPEPALV